MMQLGDKITLISPYGAILGIGTVTHILPSGRLRTSITDDVLFNKNGGERGGERLIRYATESDHDYVKRQQLLFTIEQKQGYMRMLTTDQLAQIVQWLTEVTT